MFQFDKKIDLSKFDIAQYSMNKHKWNLELVQKFYFAHRNKNNGGIDFNDPSKQ